MKNLPLLAALACAALPTARAEGAGPPSRTDLEKIVGVWSMGPDGGHTRAPLNFPVEITKDGKLAAVLGPRKGSPRSHRGTYKVKGDTLHVTFVSKGKGPQKKTFTIKHLTATKMEWSYYDGGKKVITLSRIELED
jgi:uncharacterized protein (TIGR03066 family)